MKDDSISQLNNKLSDKAKDVAVVCRGGRSIQYAGRCSSVKKHCKIYAITNQKGGVGKTTTTEALGEGMRSKGYKVLYVDLDPQANLSYCLKADAQGANTAFNVLLDPCVVTEAVQHARADIIPASRLLCGLDGVLANVTGKEYRLQEALETIAPEYDFVFIDTPPSLGVLTVNAFTAAESVIIPAQADILSLQGIAQVSETLDGVRKYTNKSLVVDGVLLTRFNPRTVLARSVQNTAKKQAQLLSAKVYNTYIRECNALKEAQLKQTSIYNYAPKSNAAADYMRLCNEILGDY